MPVFPEKERELSIQIKERPEEASPLIIERKEVARPIPVQFKRQVVGDKGQPLIQVPATQVVTITLPEEEGRLTALAKGPADDSLTWFAAFWLRMLKKAIHFGWKVFGKNQDLNIKN